MSRAVRLTMVFTAMTVVLVRGQAPARDRSAPNETVATGTLRGRVVDARTGTPLRGVSIVASTGERPAAGTGPAVQGLAGASATNGDGRYEIGSLPAGRYRVTALFAGYLGIDAGQTRPAQGGKPVTLRAGETVENLNFAMPLGGAIGGSVRDANGDPLADVQVRVLRPVYREGRRAMNAEPIVRTDDLGNFRVFGLSPGPVWLSVLSPAPGSAGGAPGVPGIPYENTGAGLTPTYYPGTTNFAEARPLMVKLGESINNADMIVVPVNNASMRGIVTEGDRPAASVQGTASQIGTGLLFVYQIRPQPDGSFNVENLMPGDYEIRLTGVSAGADKSPLGSLEWVTLAPGETRELRPSLSRMTTGSGRIVTDASAQGAFNGAAILQLMPGLRPNAAPYEARPALAIPTIRPTAERRFTFSAVPGRMVLTPYSLPAGWFVKGIRLNGADVSDSLELPVNGSVDGIEVIVTNRPSVLTGVVQGPNGRVDDYSVLVFAQDSGRRLGVTRYFGSARPEQDGSFRIAGLPPADYFAIAVEYADPDTSADPLFLESLVKDATPFTLADGEAKSVELRLVQ